MPINLEVDGQPVTVANGATVMDAATQLGVYVPHFCYHHKLSIAANCRMCLVQVEKAPKPLPACATPAAEGMKVHTHSAAAMPVRAFVKTYRDEFQYHIDHKRCSVKHGGYSTEHPHTPVSNVVGHQLAAD